MYPRHRHTLQEQVSVLSEPHSELMSGKYFSTEPQPWPGVISALWRPRQEERHEFKARPVQVQPEPPHSETLPQKPKPESILRVLSTQVF